ncbi:hypothetical protein F8C76_07860 [Flagellimonas olearia]|uniref:Uncharacterized protein n=2 Tax=Flagellimonas olearia TaxID=552546 RepID=A0A6I1E0P0_9FLAO|nr:hypothetical protein F8C76_07860 [Allomuricauda olearia]
MGTIRILFLLTFFMTTLGTSMSYGQLKLDDQAVSDLQQTSQYAFVVSDVKHFKVVLNMYDVLVDNGVKVTDYEVITKGKFVKGLVKGSELEALVEKYISKLRITVCSVAMAKHEMTKDQLIPGVEPVPAASIRMLQLQAKGYNTLSY